MAAQVTLSGQHGQGSICLVDEVDLERVLAFGTWCAIPARSTIYARAFVRGSARGAPRRHVYMHTFLTGWALVDHINRDGLDNRRVNLRAVSHGENQQNRRLNKNNTSSYRGVYLNRRGTWTAQIAKNRKRFNLGAYSTPEEAALAYDQAALNMYGANAALNADWVS